MKKNNFCLFISVLALLTSCKETSVVPDGNPPDAEVNEWILDNMKTWYFWNDKLPASPDFAQTPQNFFSSILYRYDASLRPDGDRFSWLQESADELKASLSGETTSTGLEFRLLRYASNGNELYGIVTYVIKGSPAEKAGFKRGDFFTQVNGQQLTLSNYYALLYTGKETKAIRLGQLNASNQVVDSETSRSIASQVLQSDPVYFDTVFVNGSKKVGYLVYHQFVPGPNNSSVKTYDQALEKVFASFKTKGINELIIDFRYNRGGYVSSATQLASMIAKGVSSTDVFYYKEYNKIVTPSLEKQYGKSFFFESFLTKSQNVGGNLNRVIFLTSTSTASASELVINGLKPFMPVVIIGGKTTGKNVGSITISDDSKRIKWGIQPIVSRSANSLRSSEYTAGFEPNVAKTEGSVLYPYGDPRDPLLGEALYQIYGTRVARRGVDEEPVPPTGPDVHSSIDRQAAGGNMFFDFPYPKK
ncbi:S41 family peptidase [Arundinibacter roseus]|uniref:Peptidase S41 n=1 Tax=Arundinibacter roseus TaxID=2070510 RepID=A0A4R4KAW6_9BACT|nr:S41 family peptidase [Arundinibacter roseus]TDB63796.1 peptidase S41 [Arundinibacter roseus]